MSRSETTSLAADARGLSPSREGGEHWVSERVSSVALLLLGTWLIASLLLLPSLDRATLVDWLREPWGAVPMVLFVIVAFKHALDGMKVVVDDYVHDAGNNFAVNTLLLFLAAAGAALSLFALARIAFGGEA